MLNQKTPLGIKIISVIFYVCSVFLFIFSFLLLFTFDKAKESLTKIPQIPFSQNLNSGIGIGIIAIVFALLFLLIGRGLWITKQWARIGALIFVAIGLLGSILNVISGRLLSWVNLVLYALIGAYLIWSKKVKATFSNTLAY